ncbi:MAG TPA: hypothetical protein VNW51_08055, partial [Mucilaginibacter sp.]|nr:hypothetical protein [Mucilaginibacter sp.]
MFALTVKAQQSTSFIKNVIDKIDDYNTKRPSEKLYIQFDRPYYSIGDTIWFKGYLTTPNLSYSVLSSKLYIDLVNDSNKVVKRFIFPASFGLSWGNISLDKNLREGVYTLRAYSNWMRNFGAEALFYQSFYISDPSSTPLLINAGHTINANNVKADVKFTRLDNTPFANQNLQLKLVSRNKTLFQNAVTTGTDGLANINFTLPENLPLKNLMLIAGDKKGDQKVRQIPLDIERPQDVDVQFMPESGQLIASLPTQVGFKVIGEDGRGVNVNGIITDKENNTVAQFTSLHAGMGTFSIAPQPGEIYTAKVTLPDGEIKIINIPDVKKSGILLKVKNGFDTDTLDMAVLATEDMVSPEASYAIVGQSHGIVCYAALFKINKQFLYLHIPKALFPTGIAHFTILNAQNQPINERLAFINHDDNLKIEIKPSAASFSTRDSIPLHIAVNDKGGKPIMGSFSVAVTDDTQIKDSTDNAGNIVTGLLLGSDLKGFIEDPAFYLKKNARSWKALDALLLTQGWIGYNWKDIINGPPAAQFTPEPDYAVKGRVGNLLNKPVAGARVLLLATGKYHFIKDTITNAQGDFYFHKIPAIDSVKYVLQATNTKGRTINGGITVDNVPELNADIPFNVMPAPWYVNTDPTMLNYVKNNSTYHDELEKRKYGGHLLKQVDINASAIIKGSQNLNGAGNSDQVITGNDVEKMGKVSLLDILEKKVIGFRTGFKPKSTDIHYFIKDKGVRFVIDGIDIDRFYNPVDGISNEHYEYQKQILDYLTAEDILGIEVLYNIKYNTAYKTANLSLDEQLDANPAGPRGADIAYLEITTRSGNGPFTKTATGVYVYKPNPVTLPKQFYRPAYPIKTGNRGFVDLRATIHWQPSVVTDKNGQTNVSFYAADKPATYTITVEGSD